MADSEIILNPGAGGQHLDSEAVVFGADTRERERMQIAGVATTEIARVVATVPAIADFGLVTRPLGKTFGVALTADGFPVGFLDAGGLLQAVRSFDLDTGVGTENVLGVNLRRASAGGSVETGVAGDPLNVDGTVTSDQGAPNIVANAWPILVTDGVDTAIVLAAAPAAADPGLVVREVYPTGTLANGAETAVGAAAVSILAANAARKAAIIQNTGVADIRVGVAGVTATTGLRLATGDSVVFEMPFCPTQEIFAIREGAISSTALAQEIT